MTTPTVKFFNGVQMPMVGLGTYASPNSEELENALDEALKIGYRHIDTAYVYTNEAIIGRVLKRWLDSGKIKREDLFIVTKLPFHGMHPSRVNYFLKLSLAALQLDYVDLYLVHNPAGVKYVHDDFAKHIRPDGSFDPDMETDLEGIWKAMEEQVDAGLAKSIGISSYNSDQIERMMKIARIQPANLQMEYSIYVQMKDVLATCRKHGITVVGFAPLGRPGDKDTDMLKDPNIIEIAAKYSKTPAQVALKFLLQQNVAVIPRSVSPARLRQNFELLDFTLSDEDMAALTSLDKGIGARVGITLKAARGLHTHPEWPFPPGL